jgi:hypothetical protein
MSAVNLALRMSNVSSGDRSPDLDSNVQARTSAVYEYNFKNKFLWCFSYRQGDKVTLRRIVLKSTTSLRNEKNFTFDFVFSEKEWKAITFIQSLSNKKRGEAWNDWENIYHHSDGMVVGAISISVNLWSVQMLSDTEFLHIRIGKLKITVRPGNTSPTYFIICLSVFDCWNSIGADWIIIGIIVIWSILSEWGLLAGNGLGIFLLYSQYKN